MPGESVRCVFLTQAHNPPMGTSGCSFILRQNLSRPASIGLPSGLKRSLSSSSSF